MTTLNLRFRTGHFGQDAVEGSEWHDRYKRVFPVFLEEGDRKRIELILDCLAVGDTKGAQVAFDTESNADNSNPSGGEA